jgi:hypothetical protein
MKAKLQKISGHPYLLLTNLLLNCNFTINKHRLLKLALPQQHQQALIEKVIWSCFKKYCQAGQVTF